MSAVALRESDHSRTLLRAMQRVQALYALQHNSNKAVLQYTDTSGQRIAVLGGDVGGALDRIRRQPQMVPQYRIGFRSQSRSDGGAALERGRARLAVVETSDNHNEILAMGIERLCGPAAPEQSPKPSSATTSIVH